MGIDGCGVPVFGVTVKAMALMYARLVAPPQEFDESTREACERIVSAMTRYPELIGGTKDRLDTEMMRAHGGKSGIQSRRRRRLHGGRAAMPEMAQRFGTGA